MLILLDGILYFLIQCYLDTQKVTFVWNVKILNSKRQSNGNRSKRLLLMIRCVWTNDASAYEQNFNSVNLSSMRQSLQANIGMTHHWTLLPALGSVRLRRLNVLRNLYVLLHTNFVQSDHALNCQIYLGLFSFLVLFSFCLFISLQQNTDSSTVMQHSQSSSTV